MQEMFVVFRPVLFRPSGRWPLALYCERERDADDAPVAMHNAERSWRAIDVKHAGSMYLLVRWVMVSARRRCGVRSVMVGRSATMCSPLGDGVRSASVISGGLRRAQQEPLVLQDDHDDDSSTRDRTAAAASAATRRKLLRGSTTFV
jgi:hypothetical protein